MLDILILSSGIFSVNLLRLTFHHVTKKSKHILKSIMGEVKAEINFLLLVLLNTESIEWIIDNKLF